MPRVRTYALNEAWPTCTVALMRNTSMKVSRCESEHPIEPTEVLAASPYQVRGGRINISRSQ